MGVSYLTCAECEEIFPDYISYSLCKCGADLCDDCAYETEKKYGTEENEYEDEVLSGCKACDPETVTDADILEWLLDAGAMTREEITKIIRMERRDSDG
jgi:hypothetical protein